MTQYTEEQVEEMVREAVEKTERSFGGTFKRLKSENEEYRARYEDAVAELGREKETMEQRIRELETLAENGSKRIAELAVTGELHRQLRERGTAVPERFIDTAGIEYSEDPEKLGANVAAAIERGRKEFEDALSGMGIALPGDAPAPANPTNPPSRDFVTARDLRRSGARETLDEMMGRGLLRR